MSATAQKIILVNAYRWSATVCFAGFARSTNVDVEQWLAERMGAVGRKDPFERLIQELLKADEWLRDVPHPNNRHSFSVGAFIGDKPVLALVSNFETLSGCANRVAEPWLSVYQTRPNKPKILVTGQRQAVSRRMRRRLEALARSNPDHQQMYSALAETNREVAASYPSVSNACFTTHLTLIGAGGGCAHDNGNLTRNPIACPALSAESIEKSLNNILGKGAKLAGPIGIYRIAPSSEDYHKVQIREKPKDPNVHANYGKFLQDTKMDIENAEQVYRKAIELDPNHANALGNLANLVSGKNDTKQAEDLYKQALVADPGNENVSLNYSRFLVRVHSDKIRAREVLDSGVATNPNSGRLYLSRGQLNFDNRNVSQAIEDFKEAEKLGADQKQVAFYLAFALHMGDEPIDECIERYRTAIAMHPNDGSLKLNLAQLLFIRGYVSEANKRLSEAVQSEIDESAQLEAQFYLLSHTSADINKVICETRTLLNQGGRLRWNVQQNIDSVRQNNPEKAVILELLEKIMTGERDSSLLDEVLDRWQ